MRWVSVSTNLSATLSAHLSPAEEALLTARRRRLRLASRLIARRPGRPTAKAGCDADAPGGMIVGALALLSTSPVDGVPEGVLTSLAPADAAFTADAAAPSTSGSVGGASAWPPGCHQMRSHTRETWLGLGLGLG